MICEQFTKARGQTGDLYSITRHGGSDLSSAELNFVIKDNFSCAVGYISVYNIKSLPISIQND